MTFLILKSLHIIFVVTWFSALFYIVRLFIYHTEARERPHNEFVLFDEQFRVMEKRLWYGIAWPSCILTFIFGTSMIHHYFPLSQNPFMIVKLVLVGLLFLYHLSCEKILKLLRNHQFRYSSTQLRVWNEVATIFLVAIVFLIVLQNLLGMIQALIGLFLFMVVLMSGIRFYRRIRKNNLPS